VEQQDKEKRGRRKNEEKKDSLALDSKSGDWKERVIQIRRVTKVVKGGKKLSFRAVVVVGDGQGSVGVGVGKSSEVIGAIQKAIIEARKSLVKVPIFKKTIPHPISAKAGAGKVFLKPASEGTGVIAGGSARSVLELAGIENILCKSLGSDSPLNAARATIQALSELRLFGDVAKGRGLTLHEMLN
jgi:small subunit ribosomal protein S5